MRLTSKIVELDASTATVEMAAKAMVSSRRRSPRRYLSGSRTAPLLIVTSGDARLNNRKIKDRRAANPRCSGPMKSWH